MNTKVNAAVNANFLFLRNFLSMGLGFFLALMPLKSFAYLFTGESAEIIAPENFELSVLPQLKLSDGTAFNFAAGVKTQFNESTSMGAHIGFGDTDFFGSAHFKWTPFPDFDRQPAVGFKFEGLVGREGQETLFGGRVHTIVSKKFETNMGLFVPYASLPLGMVSFRNNYDFQMQLVAGTEFLREAQSKWKFGAELGVNLQKTFTYVLGVVTYTLDSGSPRKKGRK